MTRKIDVTALLKRAREVDTKREGESTLVHLRYTFAQDLTEPYDSRQQV